MHLRMILTIFRKDVRDAIRDARVLVAILAPLGIGLFYGQIFSNEAALPKATIVYVSAQSTALPDALRAVAGPKVVLVFNQAPSAAEARTIVEEKQADVGLVLSPGFDDAVRAGQAPTLTVIRRDEASFGSSFVVSALDGALRQMAGQQAPAHIQDDVIAAPSVSSQAIFERVGLRSYFLLAVVVMLVAMIAMLVVPVILAEETEKKTLDALVMIASYVDVIVAKALVGIVYVAVTVVLLLGITRLTPVDPLLFGLGVVLLSATLIGFGLLMGGLFRSANQLNTWSGFLLLPVIFPAFVVGIDAPAWVQTTLKVLPSSQAAQILINGVSGIDFFPNPWLSVLVVAIWGMIAYGLLLLRLSRREA